MEWYNKSVKYKIPAFIDEIKKAIIDEREPLVKHRKALSERLQNAQIFFSQNRTQEEITKGIQQLQELVNEIVSTDNEIRLIDTKIATILEAKIAEVSFKVKVSAKINTLGEDTTPKEIFFVPWNTIEAEDRIEVTPEDVWAFKMLKNIFTITEKNIEFLDVEREKELYSREE